MVVFGDHQPATSGGRRGGERCRVDGFDAVAVDDAGVDALLGQEVRGVQAGVQGDAGADESYVVVVAATQDLGAADGKRLPVRVERRVGAAGGTQVGDSRCGGHRLDERGGAGGVARV